MNLTGISLLQLQEALGRLHNSTIPALIAERVAAEPDAVAVRYKRDGVFRELTWAAIARKSERSRPACCCGLEPGARIAIMGDVSIEYLLADLGGHLYRRAFPAASIRPARRKKSHT